jgi:hypothetical protein
MTKQKTPFSKAAHNLQLHSKPAPATGDDTADSFPMKAPADPTRCEHYIYVMCCPITSQIYSDLPGRFVEPPSRGYNYLLIVYDYDSNNAILAEPLKNNTGKAKVYETI